MGAECSRQRTKKNANDSDDDDMEHIDSYKEHKNPAMQAAAAEAKVLHTVEFTDANALDAADERRHVFLAKALA